MAYSIVTHTGDGSTTTFPINFTLGFISRDDVKCRVGSEVDGLDQPIYRALTWITDGLVQVQGDPAALGVTVEFTRTVDKDQLIHDYSDGAAITEDNLDDSNKQTLMALHEFLDDRVRVTPTSDLDMNSYKITNLANGTNPQDAVTVLQAGQAIALTPVAVQAAEDAADALVLAQAAQAAAEAAASSASSTLSSCMIKTQNLNDVQSKSTSRTNLDVYSKSESIAAAVANVTKSNVLINGDMRINQRKETGTQAVTATPVYTLDRWVACTRTAPSGTLRVSRTETTEAAYPYALRMARTAGSFLGIMTVAQIIESINCKHLQGGSVTISCKARVGSGYLGGTPSIKIAIGTGTDEGSTAALAGTWTGYDVSPTYPLTGINTAFQNFTFTVTPVPSTTKEIAVLIDSGAAWSGSGSSNDWLEITDVQLVQGSVQTLFDRRSFSQELALCQRYFEKSYANGTAIGATSTYGAIVSKAWAASTFFGNSYPFVVEKRVAPTFAVYSPGTGTVASLRDVSGSADYSVSAASTDAKGYRYLTTSSTLTATSIYTFHFTADSEI